MSVQSVDSRGYQMLDVAIVGAGVSGAYAAWRLIKSEKFQNVGLFELSDRIGGRLFSVPIPKASNIYAELGGMYFSEGQAIVSQLVRELQLQIRAATFPNEENRLFLRNKNLHFSDMTNFKKIPYQLCYNEQGLDSEELFRYAVNQAIPHLSELTPDYFDSNEWQSVRKNYQLDGQYFYNMSIWELLLKSLSQEAYNFCLDTGYFYSDIGTWNAAQAIETSLTIPYDQPWYMLEKGYQQLPLALVNKFKENGGQVYLNYRLSEFEFNPIEHFVSMKFANPSGDLYPPIIAKHLILALPKRALELLAEKNRNNILFGDINFRTNIKAVTGDPAYKLFLGYEYPWWRTLGLTGGFSVTDLPLRRCYYFGTETEEPGGEPNNHRSLLLANFPDGRSASFWQSMAYDPVFPERHPAFRNAFDHSAPKLSVLTANQSLRYDPLLASENMVNTAQQQLKALHGLSYIPNPYCAFYIDWAQDPYGGGWHTWNPHCQPWEIMPQMRHPVKNANIYICGEAYSNRQGWVQGALNSTERMLEDNFNLERPSWLPITYDLGP